MKIIIRVDANQQIGTGHFFRCMTLGKKAISRGHHVTFVSRYMPNDLVDILNKNKITFKSIYFDSESELDKLNHSHWLGTSQIEDAKSFINCVDDKYDLLIIDNYGIDHIWENKVSSICNKTLVIDDLADRQHKCDYLLDQNLYKNPSSRYKKKLLGDTKTFFGPKFSILRDDFIYYRSKKHSTKKTVKRIFVFFGSIDLKNHTKVALDAIIKSELKNVSVDVVVGGQNPNKRFVEQICRDNNFNFYCQTSEIAKIMSQANLAIGAGGSTSWERCCLGLPSIIIPIAQNQIEISKNLNESGAALKISRTKNLKNHICNSIKEINSGKKDLTKMSEICSNLVDGLGSERLLNAINL